MTGVEVRWSQTVMMQTGFDHAFQGSFSRFVRCEAPLCWLACNAPGTAGAGITVPDGYTCTSLSGNRYLSMLGEDNGGGPVGGEIPEPSTIVLSAAGLVALGLARLRRHPQRH